MKSSTPRPIIWFPPPGTSGTGASFGGGRLGGNFAVITGVVPITVGPIGGALYSGALAMNTPAALPAAGAGGGAMGATGSKALI